VIADHLIVILLCCTILPVIANAHIYPVFTPNDYLFEKFGDGKKAKWEIYADAVREIMCKETGMKPCD